MYVCMCVSAEPGCPGYLRPPAPLDPLAGVYMCVDTLVACACVLPGVWVLLGAQQGRDADWAQACVRLTHHTVVSLGRVLVQSTPETLQSTRVGLEGREGRAGLAARQQ